MLDPKPEDYAQLERWPMVKDPLASIKQYRPIHRWLRWLKPSHVYMHYVYWTRRAKMAKPQADMQDYYKQARIGLPRYKWEYLKLRKSWFIVPLRWDRFAQPDCTRLLDAGCGDGDVTQRIIHHIEQEWARSGGGHPLEVTGVDLNPSRIENAKDLVQVTRPEIKLSFAVANAVEGFTYPDQYFDYAANTGVLEILSDEAAADFVKNLCRVVKKGIFVEDLADRYPGGFPREDLGRLFEPHGFKVVEHHWQLTEPFSLFSQPDPCYREMTWPVQRDQVLWLERVR